MIISIMKFKINICFKKIVNSVDILISESIIVLIGKKWQKWNKEKTLSKINLIWIN